ncbi:unnamed protein product [Toxocara canis]|uniref:DUF3330 domain-containing protein n=1 Tax=Toxocara canis TaxID=6265 RepID=A0A183UFD0_TOXCA|nr:unnamed protein product [Toxocara canis]
MRLSLGEEMGDEIPRVSPSEWQRCAASSFRRCVFLCPPLITRTVADSAITQRTNDTAHKAVDPDPTDPR